MSRPIYIPKIETIYRVCIEWDVRSDALGDPDVCDIYQRIDKLRRPKCVEFTDHGAGPCWNAYIIITGSRRASVEKFARKVLRLMARYRKLTIYAGIVGTHHPADDMDTP